MREEYHLVVIRHIKNILDIEIIFNGLAEEGYVLVAVDDGIAYFKRSLSIGIYDDEIVKPND